MFFSGMYGFIGLSNKELQKFVIVMDAFSVEYDKIDLIETHRSTYQFSKTDRNNLTIPRAVYRDSKYFSLQTAFADTPEHKRELAHISNFPTYHEIIHMGINPKSVFANTLYYSQGYTDAIPPYIQGGNSFLGFLRYFFAKYIQAFESFDRIAPCAYKPCGKLFYKIRYGRGDYCCETCGNENHKATQDNDKRLCRGNHNAWIDRIAMGTPQRAQHVYKTEHCDVKCELPIGKREVCEHTIGKKKVCPNLYELNKELCDAYKEIKER